MQVSRPFRSMMQSAVATSPMGLRTKCVRGRRERDDIGDEPRGPTARETYANLKILRHISRQQVRNGWISSLVIPPGKAH